MARETQPTTASPVAAPITKMPRRVSETPVELTRSAPLRDQHHFPFKLYDMLEYAADSECSSAVSWTDDGKGFFIHNKDLFLKDVVPNFFKQTKFRSFTRQLNLWGFSRHIGTGPKRGSWEHKDFGRGKVDRLSSIQRVEVKNHKPKTAMRKSKNTKPKQSQTYRERQAITARAATPSDSSSDGCLSLAAEETLVTSRVSPVINAPFQPNSAPSNALLSQEVATHDGIRAAGCSAIDRTSQCQSAYYPLSIQTSTCYSLNVSQPQMDEPQQNQTDFAHNDGDLLFVLSGIFGSEESSHDDDLASILSLDEASEGYMHPISF